MNKKNILFLGIGLLTTGILLRVFSVSNIIAIPFIVAGSFLKFAYLAQKIKKGNYKPGFELFILLLGILLFFSGIYLKPSFGFVKPTYFIVAGLILKVSFVVLFVKKIKTKKRAMHTVD